MYTGTRAVAMIGLLGVVALVGTGCSKSIQTDAGAKSFEPALQAKQEGAGPGAGGAGPRSEEAPVTRFGSLPGDVEPGAAQGRTGKGGEEQVSESIAVAKAEPSESVRQQNMEQQQQMEQRQQEQAATAAAGLDDVYFSYDSWKLTDDGKQALSKDAEWLKANGTRMLAVEGHCDERGTQAYNLVLGQKRAKTVRNYLIELGVAGNRIAAVSYGKDRPFCKESNEACYQQNRRGHMVVNGK